MRGTCPVCFAVNKHTPVCPGRKAPKLETSADGTRAYTAALVWHSSVLAERVRVVLASRDALVPSGVAAHGAPRLVGPSTWTPFDATHGTRHGYRSAATRYDAARQKHLYALGQALAAVWSPTGLPFYRAVSRLWSPEWAVDAPIGRPDIATADQDCHGRPDALLALNLTVVPDAFGQFTHGIPADAWISQLPAAMQARVIQRAAAYQDHVKRLR